MRLSQAFSVASVKSCVDEIEDASKDFERSLMNKTDQELKNLHKLNMGELDNL